MNVLSIAIGLVLIYFLYSLLSSIIAEILSSWIGMRARMLRQGIDNILNDKRSGTGQDFKKWLQDIFLVEADNFKYTNAGKFYEEPTIKYLAKPGEHIWYSLRNRKPSYISPENFAITVLNMFSNKGKGISEWDKIKFAIANNAMHFEPETHKMFQNLVNRSNDSFNNFVDLLLNHFADTMDRVNGWYKRKIGTIIFYIGLFLCTIFNVDTIQIVKTLSNNSEKRLQMIEMAERIIDTNASIDTLMNEQDNSEEELKYKQQALAVVKDAVFEANDIVAAGWNFEDKKGSKVCLIFKEMSPFKSKFWGIIITALALTLGAQFWFDLLKKFVSLRSVGVKPDKIEEKENHLRAITFQGEKVTSKDPVEIAISENRAYWESLPGYIAYNVIKNKDDQYIELALEADLGQYIKETVEVFIDMNLYEVRVKKLIAEKCKLFEEPISTNGTLNQNSTSVKGTAAGLVLNKRTGKRAILTCGHVVKSNDSLFLDETPMLVSASNGQKWIRMGRVSNLVISSFADAALIDLQLEAQSETYSWLSNLIKPIRKIKILDYKDEHKTIVSIDTLRGIIKGKVIHTRRSWAFYDNKGQTFRFFDLILVESKSMTQAGDSGSLIYLNNKSDIEKTAVGMLIGGGKIDGKNYCFACKISNLIEICQFRLFN